MLKVEQVDFSYSQRSIFKNLSLELCDHEITTIIGPNGSGKSTLFKLLTRELKPNKGQISLDKKNIWQLSARKYAQQVALVHQKNMLYDELTVNELVKMGRLPYHSLFEDKKNSDQKKIAKIMDYLEISSLKDKFVSELSGGQQQRVWLAVALAQEPRYLLLDEPTTYLDLHFQYRFLKLLKKLNKDQGLTICMILHDLNQALQFSHQIILLNKGQIKAQGKAEDVITSSTISKNFAINCELIDTPQGKFLHQF